MPLDAYGWALLPPFRCNHLSLPMIALATVRPLFAAHGELRPQMADAWTGPAPLPPEVAAFYAEVGPWGNTIYPQVGPVGITLMPAGLLVNVPPLHKLHAAQSRYPSDARPNANWRSHWLVVASSNGDPFIFDGLSRRVLFAQVGRDWSPQEFAPNLPTAMAALARLSLSYQDLSDLDDEALDIHDEELTAAGWEKIESDLSALVGKPCAQRMIEVLNLR